jgi:hypothetical protein
MAEFDKAFGKTGAGNEEEMNRKKDLKELTSVFSKKNIFGKEKPAEEATQAAILEQNKSVESAIRTLPNQEQLLKDIADVFTAQKREASETAFEAEQDRLDQNKILTQQTETGQETAKASKVQAKESKNRGSMLGKMGGALAGAGIAAAGIGVALFASAKALKEFENVNMKKVSGNVKEILEIVPKADGEGALLKFYAEGGTLAAVLGGLGIGLGVFAIGGAAAGAAEKFAGFDGQSIKDNVLTLLSISEASGGNFDFLIDSAFFLAAMTGIAGGLAVFGGGSATAALGTGAAEGINHFSSDETFADTIKKNVLTLLSIDEAVGGKGNLIGESAVFLGAMTTIAAGLALFGAGAATAGLGQGAAEGIAKFSGTGDLFAQQIKDNVVILLSIDDAIKESGDSFIGESSQFFKAMTGIGAGLAVFGVGSAIAGVGSGLSAFTSKEGNFAQDIKDKITTLLSIGDDRTDLQKDAETVKSALGTIGDGIASFGSDEFSAALSSFGSKAFNFLSGANSPLVMAMDIADKSDELEKGANSLTTLADGFGKLGNIESAAFKIDNDTIENLVEFSNAMTLLAGGSISEDGFIYGEYITEGQDQTIQLLKVANAFNALADGMERVNDSAKNLSSADVMSGIELYSSGSAANMGVPVIINQISNSTSNVTSAPTTVVGIEAEGRQLANSATNSD